MFGLLKKVIKFSKRLLAGEDIQSKTSGRFPAKRKQRKKGKPKRRKTEARPKRKSKKKIVRNKKKRHSRPKVKSHSVKKAKAVKPAGIQKRLVKVADVTHFFPNVNAAAVKLAKPLSVGDFVLFKGETTDFRQKIQSLQISRIPVDTGRKGEEVGIEVKERVRAGDEVFIVK